MPPPPPSPSPSDSSSACSDDLSIHELVRRHCRERLLVKPILWTNRQVELLNFSFEEPSLAPPMTEPPNFTSGTNDLRLVKRLLSSSRLPSYELLGFLADDDCPFVGEENQLEFNFDQRSHGGLPSAVFYTRDASDIFDWYTPPVAAYIESAEIQDMRIRNTWARINKWENPPMHALYQLQLKKITPPNRLHDPYILALFIGMAQKQREAAEHEQKSLSTFSSQVLFTDPNDREFMHLFAADIPSSLLDKFKSPALPPSVSAPPTIPIWHTLIPYNPHSSLRNRIFALMVQNPNPKKRNARKRKLNSGGSQHRPGPT